MKKLLFSAVLISCCLTFKLADAQLRIHANLNIGSQPEWGPVGYTHADYYYMPDIDAYYDVANHQYVYYDNNVWVHNRVLPPRYGNFDRYHSYKVVVNQRDPWEHEDQIRARYSHYRGRHDQQVIRDSRDDRYRNQWRGDRHDNGRRDHGDNGRRDHGDNGRRDHDDNGRRDHGDHH